MRQARYARDSMSVCILYLFAANKHTHTHTHSAQWRTNAQKHIQSAANETFLGARAGLGLRKTLAYRVVVLLSVLVFVLVRFDFALASGSIHLIAL